MNIAFVRIVDSVPACHARNRGSIPRRGVMNTCITLSVNNPLGKGSIPHRGVATFYIILSANITFEKGSTKDFNCFLFLLIRTCVVRINLNTNTKLPLVFSC